MSRRAENSWVSILCEGALPVQSKVYKKFSINQYQISYLGKYQLNSLSSTSLKRKENKLILLVCSSNGSMENG